MCYFRPLDQVATSRPLSDILLQDLDDDAITVIPHYARRCVFYKDISIHNCVYAITSQNYLARPEHPAYATAMARANTRGEHKTVSSASKCP